jgi:hypothetical protein
MSYLNDLIEFLGYECDYIDIWTIKFSSNTIMNKSLGNMYITY